MKSNDLLRLADDPRFIPGIYNYCDRWCERCALSSRCLNYAMEQQDANPAVRDPDNAAFWNKLKSVFQQTEEFLLELAKEKGIDLNQLEANAAVEEKRRKRAEAKSHPLANAARQYAQMVDKWFDAAGAIFEDKAAEWKAKLGMGGPMAELQGESSQLKELIEVIRWYQHFIYVKLTRGISQQADQEAERDLQNDSNGSVNVALIAMDRSIGAWAEFRNHFPEKTDDLISLLLHLDRLRRASEQHFPNARKFIRPGFDTGALPAAQ